MNKPIDFSMAGCVRFCSAAARSSAQLGERPGNSLDNPIDTPRDLSGLSIKNPRVRVVHTTDPQHARAARCTCSRSIPGSATSGAGA